MWYLERLPFSIEGAKHIIKLKSLHGALYAVRHPGLL